MQTPKPSPASFAKETYFGITALRFINHAGVARYGRHRISPESGVEHPSEAAAQGKDANYLFEELTHRLATGLIRFQIAVQIANERDIVDDATVHWPEERPLIPLGTVALNARAADNNCSRGTSSSTQARAGTRTSPTRHSRVGLRSAPRGAARSTRTRGVEGQERCARLVYRHGPH